MTHSLPLQTDAVNRIHPKESSYAFTPLGLGKARTISPYVFHDARGEFFECFHLEQFEQRIGVRFVQDCVSVSRRDTLRGIHGDYRTWKLIQCVHGAVMAAIVDLNPGSKTYFQSRTVFLNDRNRTMLLVPPGFGNSFLVLSDEAVYSYKKSTYFKPGAEFTLHHAAEGTGIDWPIDSPRLSARDTQAPRQRATFAAAMRHRHDLEGNPFLEA